MLMELTPTVWIKETDFPRREITSVNDAMQFLDTWPDDKRDPFFDLAKNALQGAINGAIPTVEARDAFETFCREAGILAG
jgi:hypothetical protein